MREQGLLDLVNLTTGKLNSNMAVENGKYPFFTCSPETLLIEQFSFDTKALLLAGNNAEGNFCLKYYEGKFDAYQRTYVLTLDDESATTYKYLFYYLKTKLLELKNNSAGSATRFLTLSILRGIRVPLPPLPEQKAIAAVLSSLDDKIDLLHRQNKTLEAMAETLFRQWFIEETKADWEEGVLGQLIDLKYGKALKQEDRSGTGYPVMASSGIVGFHKEYLVEGPGIVIGRKGTLGKVYFIVDNFYPIDTSYFIQSKVSQSNLIFEYFLLKSLDFVNMNSDSAVPGLNRDIALGTQIQIPPHKSILEFNQITCPWFSKFHANTNQIQTLEKLRDTLLPKLMSGEVRVQFEEQTQ
ncbi:restriction endonuclease subunit S [Acinetobacter larvae]|uniref:Type I restriction modification DNA specificity domain-containing protein n=1 Tax=Acinetobacter larvae TaxID=1789224 RepID=A0A1B2LVX9_9GAMM|nr:restriction endonuclease subunit S [Acinetobacter larvae]AOA57085.1 hypothetical protein BFG52_01115 [Acinetobacter larvae]